MRTAAQRRRQGGAIVTTTIKVGDRVRFTRTCLKGLLGNVVGIEGDRVRVIVLGVDGDPACVSKYGQAMSSLYEPGDMEVVADDARHAADQFDEQNDGDRWEAQQ